MPLDRPEIEILEDNMRSDPEAEALLRNRNRIRIFTTVFAVAGILALAFTFLRPPVYTSFARLLIEPAAQSGANGQNGVATTAEVALERQILTTGPILGKLVDKLATVDTNDDITPQNVAALLAMIRVAEIPGTNVLELRAEGADAELLPVILNSWADVYLAHVSEQQTAMADDSGIAIGGQVKELKAKVVDKRKELDWFRRQNNIVSMEREENQILKRLRGLTDSFNDASAEKVNTEARLSAMREAVAAGRPVTLDKDTRVVGDLEQRALELAEELREYEQKYTPEYIAMDPNMKILIRKLRLVQEKLEETRLATRRAALAQAEQDAASAARSVATIQEQLSDYRQIAADFTTRFAEHESLREDLAALELRYREAQDLQVQGEVNRIGQMMSVRVLDRATRADSPTSPRYARDAALSVGGSVLLGMLAVLFFEFFNRPARNVPGTFGIPFPFIMRPTRAMREIASAGPHPGTHPASLAPAIEDRRRRELSVAEVGAMITAANGPARVLIGVLMSGATLGEAAAMNWRHLDLGSGAIRIAGANAREIVMSSGLKALVIHLATGNGDGDAPIWRDGDGGPLSPGDLDALVSCAAHDGGITDAGDVSAVTLWHTYITWLVRQGARLGELERIGGHMAPGELAALAALSPPGPGMSLDEMLLAYPAMKHLPMT